MKMIQYNSCGLNNIFLLNGYCEIEYGGQRAYSIHNLDGLHRVIGERLCDLRRSLKGEELRFLRIELDMSQKALGEVFGKSDQAIAKWEKGDTDVPRACDLILRNIYLEHIGENPLVTEMIKQINILDRRIQEERLTFQENENMEWSTAA